jgi:regulator of protease activity HflC (stomatin/prohibitin superfamily)
MQYLLPLLALLVCVLLVGSLVRRLFHRTVVFEYERGLLYHNGRFVRILEPGAYRHVASSSTVVKLDTRPRVVSVPGQEVLSSDGISLKISLAAQYAVTDPHRATNASQNLHETLYLQLQLALRAAVSTRTAEAVLADRQQLGDEVLAAVAPQAEAAGLTLTAAQPKDITLPGDLKRAFAQVALAQKEGLAALERARGESAALRNLANAARLLDGNPSLLQLRALQAVSQSSGNTVVFNAPPPGRAAAAEETIEG